MTVYATIYGLLSMAAVAHVRSRAAVGVLGFVLFVILWLFIGARVETGCDYSQYLFHFERLLRETSYTNAPDRSGLGFFADEIGFFALNMITIRLGLDFVWINLFAAAVYLTCMFMFVRRFENPALILLCYFPVLMVQLGMGNLRQCLAVGIMFLALNALCERRRIWVTLWVLLAFTFHNSAVIFLPLAVFADRNLSVARILLAALVFAPIVAFLISGRIETYADRYLDHRFGEKESIGGILRLGILLAGSTVFLVFRRWYQQRQPSEYRLIFIYALLSLALVFLLPISSTIVHRIGYYLMPVLVLPIALAPAVLFPQTRRQLLMFAPVGLFFIYLTGWLSYSAHARDCWLPYQSALSSGY